MSASFYACLDLEAVNNVDIVGIGLAVVDEDGILKFKKVSLQLD
jgi:hypothetical protein